MKKFLVLFAAAMFLSGVMGCAKKQTEEVQEPMSMEAMSTVNVATPQGTEAKAPAAAPATTVSTAAAPDAAKLEPLPPSGPFKPSVTDIQTALKNAGFYTGKIDGSLGPKTKKAIEAFQKANNLKADGKVGPKTWELLKTHLIQAVAPAKAQ